jgi:hypothetical protein
VSALIGRLWEWVTGSPYWTGRCASQEFGLSIAAQYADELERMSDIELYMFSPHQWAARARARGHDVVLVDVDECESEVIEVLRNRRAA